MMANKQVRLDADVVELVAARAQEWGMSSLSAATNRLLRQVLARAGQERSSRVPAAQRGKSAKQQPPTPEKRVERSNPSRSSVEGSKSVNPSGAAPITSARSRPTSASSKCAHPISRRIGDSCAVCGKLIIAKV